MSEETPKKNKKISRMTLQEVMARIKQMEDQGHKHSTYYRHLNKQAAHLKAEYIKKEAASVS